MKKIGIVTSARELNYGAVLQAYALQETVSRLGYDAFLLWWSNQKESHRDIRIKKIIGMLIKYVKYPKILRKSVSAYGHTFKKEITANSIGLFEEYEHELLKIDFLNYIGMKKFANSTDCKAVIAGSDQIWNSYAIYVDPFYYLQFAPENKRISYAPSLGKNDIPRYNRNTMKKFISAIRKLSVREESGRRLIESLIDKPVKVVLDPSFLLDAHDWKHIENNNSIDSEYILLYFLDQPTQVAIEMIKKILKDKGGKIVALSYRFSEYETIENIEFVDAGPREFLSLIDRASIVLTDSFHGTAFSINFNKNFYTFDRQYGSNQTQASRITDLLQAFGLSNRFISDSNGEVRLSEIQISYKDVNDKLAILRDESIKYLSEAIESCD